MRMGETIMELSNERKVVQGEVSVEARDEEEFMKNGVEMIAW